MARVTRAAKGGAGYFGLIFFIVLSLALIGGYVWLFPQYAKRGSSLTSMQRDIKENIEDKVKDLGVSGKPTASSSDAAYDSAFFRKVGEAAIDGMKYRKLVELTGFPGEDPAGLITTELQKYAPPQKSLREQIDALRGELARMKTTLDRTVAERNTAFDAQKSAQELRDRALADAKKDREENAGKVAAVKANFDKMEAEYKKQADMANEDAKKAWAKVMAQAEESKAQTAKLQGQVDLLTQQTKSLEAQLVRKKQEETPEKIEGRVLQANLIEGVVIISLGKRESMVTGDRLTVTRAGKGGTRITKAELQIVRVDDLVSRAEILKQDLNDPIVRDDVVEIQKQTKKAT